VAVAAGLAGAAVVAAVLLARDPSDGTSATSGSFTATAPWRLVIEDHTSRDGGGDIGCTVDLTNDKTGSTRTWDSLYGKGTYQMQESGTFHYQTSDPGCLVTNLNGDGGVHGFPVIHLAGVGDTVVFESPGMVSVEVQKWTSSTCSLELHSATNGDLLAAKDVPDGAGPVKLDSHGPERAYIAEPSCQLLIKAAH
jgi:hypothetical protein